MKSDIDKFRDECGVFGMFGHSEASTHVALGLHALQHRGQEAAGVVSFDGKQFHSHKGIGLVSENFTNQDVMSSIVGECAIGHNRYSTSGEKTLLRNVQPLFADILSGGIAISHNGNITNSTLLRNKLTKQGCIFQSTMDTEVIIHLIATSSYKELLDKVIDALNQLEGAYSLLILTNEGGICARDPFGIRPLVLGEVETATIISSETCALDIIGAKYIRDIEPGEIVTITKNEYKSLKGLLKPIRKHFCIFEYIYFSRPDSILDGKNVYEVRKNIGIQLAKESAVKADIIVPVPDSGVPASIGYASYSGIPFDLGIIRSHYIGRTFIQPTDSIRHLEIKLKHNANTYLLKDKKVILVDDSIVRGTTSIKIVEMIRKSGASEIHMRIASPPITNSCFYGIDTPEKNELLASKMNPTKMAEYIGVDSLAFISLEGLYYAINKNKQKKSLDFCDACFTGNYPIRLSDQQDIKEPGLLSLLNESKDNR